MRLSACVGLALSMSIGCGGGSMPSDGGGGIDAPIGDGGGTGCGPDGAECGVDRICVSNVCRDRGCGDDYLDLAAGEECDDGNDVFGDGCSSCQFDCEMDSECGTGDPCEGTSACNTTTHACTAGTPLVEGTACTTTEVPDGVCRSVGGAMQCVGAGCGNSVVDGTEECDDGRDGDDADGCRDDCTFTCETDAECDDNDACSGAETCNTTAHTCTAGTALECDDGSACTTDSCDSGSGCRNVLIDADMDGHAPRMATCGDDCNDNEARMYPGASEACDGLDNDCNTVVDDGRPTWWADCDGDGYAPAGAVMREQCDVPPVSATGCGSGGAWVMRNPATGADCNDANASARPGGTEVVGDGVDQDCDGGEICYLDNDDDGYRPAGGATLPSTDVDCTDAREARSIDPTTDCNDSAGAIRPGASEIAGDEIDQDCNGGETCYADADNDGYRPNSTATRASSDTDCRDSGEAVAGDPTGDCDDSNAAVRPGATEMTGDGVDQDCDGRETCYADADNDGYRPNGTATVSSADPDCDDPGEARSGEPTTDCCDTDGNAFPGSTYFGTTTRTGCTGYDYNCDGTTTQQYPSGYSGCTYTMTCATGRGYPCSQTSGNGFVAGWGNMTGTYTYTPDTTPPSCGQTGSYVATCNPPSGVFDCGSQTYCAYQASTRTQGCR